MIKNKIFLRFSKFNINIIWGKNINWGKENKKSMRIIKLMKILKNLNLLKNYSRENIQKKKKIRI